MDIPELRPLGVGELLDRSFKLYRHHFWLFVGIMLIPAAFSIPFNIAFLSMPGAMTGFGGRPAPPSGSFLFIALSFFALFWLLYALATGAATYAVSDTYLGRTTTVRGSYGRVLGRVFAIIGVAINVALRMFGIALLAVLVLGIVVAMSTAVARASGNRMAAGIIIGVALVVGYVGFLVFFLGWSTRYSVSISALLLENVGVIAAVRRSVRLTKGRRWQIFVALLVTMVIAYAGIIIFQGPLWVSMMMAARHGPLASWQVFTYAILGSCGGALTMPLLMIVLVLFYYDTRIRKEAFDLQFMMSSLDPPAAPAGSVSSPA
jgi:hypothetical protein